MKGSKVGIVRANGGRNKLDQQEEHAINQRYADSNRPSLDRRRGLGRHDEVGAFLRQ